jgi:hypothetical protein
MKLDKKSKNNQILIFKDKSNAENFSASNAGIIKHAIKKI